MSEKINRTRIGDLTGCCAICLMEEESRRAAKECDGVHYHQFCGSMVIVKSGKLTCGQKHPHKTIVNYTKKTKEEAVPPGETRRWS